MARQNVFKLTGKKKKKESEREKKKFPLSQEIKLKKN